MALITLRFISGESLGKFRLEESDTVEALRALGDAKLPLGQRIQSLLLDEVPVESGPLAALSLPEEPVLVAVLGEQEPETFLVHDNGGRPFKVNVLRRDEASPGRVSVHQQDLHSQEMAYKDPPVLEEMVERVFVGTSPRDGKDFDGNTLLLQKSATKYIFVGHCVFSFEAEAEICSYSSPVGNSDVPYPFAVDKHGRSYLLLEQVVLKDVPEGESDPYRYYYSDDFQKKLHWQLLWAGRRMSFPAEGAAMYQRMMKLVEDGQAEGEFSVRKGPAEGGSVETLDSEAAFVEVVETMSQAYGVGHLRGREELVSRLW